MLPTKTETKNGWSAPALAEYIKQREKAAMIRVFGSDDPKKRKRILRVQNVKKFNPLAWGRPKR